MTTRFVPVSSFDRLAASFFTPNRAAPRLDRQIPVDAVQRAEGLVLHFDLPGVPEDAIELSVERRVLSVRAERPSAIHDDDTVFLAERPVGPMGRQIVLGDTLDLDAITARHEHGVLTVSIPVSERSRHRRIEISHAPVSTSASLGDGGTES